MLSVGRASGEMLRMDRDHRISRGVRFASVATIVVWFVLAIGLFERMPWATVLWPWPDVRLSFIFLSSIAAAIAGATVWIGLTGERATITPVALNAGVVMAGMAIYLVGRAWRHGEPRLLLAGAVCATLAASGAYLAWKTIDLPLWDSRPIPALLRGALVAICLILAAVGSALLLQVPHVFPWDLSPQTSTMFGWFYLGAACSFAYCAVRSSWTLAAGQLLGFMAYDVVLFIPYIQMLGSRGSAAPGADPYGGLYGSAPGTTGGPNEASLIVYLLVLGASFLLGLYYLVINPATRVSWRSVSLR